MNPVDRLIATACEIYERDPSPLMVSAYRNVLGTYPEDVLVSAFERHIADPRAGSFFPKPADLMRHIRADASRLAEQQFDSVMRAICDHRPADATPEVRAAFSVATQGASTFDLRRWTYEQWDRARSRYVAPDADTTPQLARDSRALEHHHAH